ncbi:LysR family transcriptional regulator [Lactobacillus juensis]|uniref:LysR family transcriptional regulator n=1 Tax=Lactobacillus juensis TaxID=3082862 RepID=UPI0030C6A9E1
MKNRTLFNILNCVPDSKSLTEISNKLFISQPYISELIHATELKYHIKLIKRDTLPIELTEAGSIFRDDLEQFLELENKLKRDIYPFSGLSNATIKIGFHQPWTIVAGAQLCIMLQKKFPTTRFEFIELTSDLGEHKLLTRDIDIFVGKEFHHKKFKTNFVAKEPLSIIVPPSSSLYKRNFITHDITKKELGRFEGENFVSLTDDSFFQKMVDQMFLSNGISIKISVKFSSIVAAARAATNGAGNVVTITNVVKQFIDETGCNIYNIPTSLLKLDLGLSYLNGSSKLIKTIANKLTQLIQVLN